MWLKRIGVATALVCWSGTAPAQSWNILDEVEYAQSLARFRMFDLAGEYLSSKQDGDLSTVDSLSLKYAGALIAKIAGEFAADDDARLGFLRNAITGYADFLDTADSSHDRYRSASTDLAEANRSLGRLLGELMARGEVGGSSRDEAEKAFRASIQQLDEEYNRRQAEFEDMDESTVEPEEYEQMRYAIFEPLFLRAQTYYDFAQLYNKSEFNREDYLTRALETAEELLWEIPTDSLQGLRIFYYQGLNYLELGDMDQALGYLEQVTDAEAGAPSFIEYNPDLHPSFVRQITELTEQAYLVLARHYNNEGSHSLAEEQLDVLDAYYEKYENRGVKRGDVGDACLLERGVALYRQGKAGGMELLEDVSQRHGTDEIGRLAANYITEILEGGSASGSIPPSTWITAAQNYVSEGQTFQAVEAYHQALAASDSLTDTNEQSRTRAQCWTQIGNLYRGQKRWVEASLAYREGFQSTSDEETRKSMGVAWFNSLTQRHKETKDAGDAQKKDAVMRQLGNLGLENMAFLLAKDDFEAAKVESEEGKRREAFKVAEQGFKSVKAGDNNYERSLIYLARCEAEVGDFDKAIKLLKDFEKRTQDKRYDPGFDPKKKQMREVAHTEATFYRAIYEGKRDNHKEALNVLDGFEDKFPGQEDFFSLVNYERIKAMLAADPPMVTEAENLYEAKKGGLLPVEAQYQMGKTLLDRGRKAVEAGDESGKELIKKGADFMFAFCEATGFDSFRNLRTAADAYREIEAWDLAERSYRKVLDVFRNDGRYREEIQQSVNRYLGETLLRRNEYQEAAPLYAQLVKLYENDLGVLRRAAECFGGRVDVVDRKPIEVPGSGDYEEAIKLWDKIVERGFLGEGQKYSPEWWEAKFYTIYSRYRARDISPEWRTQAKKIMQNLDSMVLAIYDPSEHSDLLGGSDWVKRYEYLRTQLR